ncbi:MAG: Transposase IS200 like protein [bacterium ADurb.Bin478]|nr:MAG: Transposase IS200 like protein [bacterium ADurb.Bin478]
MNDHYHLILAVVGDKKLDQIIAGIDKYTALRINRLKQREGRFWQQGFYDHAIHGYKEFLNTLHYIHQNPVRKNLAESAELYRFSTAHPFYQHLIDWEWFY